MLSGDSNRESTLIVEEELRRNPLHLHKKENGVLEWSRIIHKKQNNAVLNW